MPAASIGRMVDTKTIVSLIDTDINDGAEADAFAMLPRGTQEAINETEAMLVDKNHKVYQAVEDVFAALGI